VVLGAAGLPLLMKPLDQPRLVAAARPGVGENGVRHRHCQAEEDGRA
jgi:hypothetical protein